MERNAHAEAATEATDVVAVYMTFPTETSALDVAKTLVDRRLVACVNVLPGATSVFRWEGEVAREREAVAVAKTTRGALPALCQAVVALHPYELPCIVTYPASGGLDGYLAWVRGEVAPGGGA